MVSFRSFRFGKVSLAVAAVAVALLTLQPSAPAHAAAYTVTITADTGAGSLRQAILDANANPGLDTITFGIGGTLPYTITLASNLPVITDPVVLDATSQPGYTVQPIVWIDAGGKWECFHLSENTGHTTIKGFAIGGCASQAIYIFLGDGDTIQRNFVGTFEGVIPASNAGDGIYVLGDSNDLIGGPGAADGNLVSNSGLSGIRIEGSSGTVVQGNLIGTDIAGYSPMPNKEDGVRILSSSDTTVGGAGAVARNVISGNGQNGIEMSGSDGTSNTIQFNMIGLDISGRFPLANGWNGVSVGVDSPDILIGGDQPGQGNIISANKKDGIRLESTHGVTVLGNLIGTDITGALGLGNTRNGIELINPGYVLEGTANNIGGIDPATGNVIAANGLNGIQITNMEEINIGSNDIGTDQSHSIDLGNGAAGVNVDQSAGSVIGSLNWIMFNDTGVVTNSDITIQYNRIRRNHTGIRIDNGGSGTWTIGNCIASNVKLGMKNTTTVMTDAGGNWWGAVSGPTHWSNPSGKGEGVSDFVDFTPWNAISCADLLGS